MSSYTLSTNATQSDLAGPGRLLGKLYGVGGRALESPLSVAAQRVGLGPDACMRRIREELSDDRLLPSAQLAAKAHRDAKAILDLMATKGRLMKECRRMLSYAK